MSKHARWSLLGIFVLVGTLWASQISGLASSNDGSHAALSRAIWGRAQTTIDPDVDLTLGVDRARREGRWYSDRPPGTALAVGGLVALGASFDHWAFRQSVARERLLARPGTDPYILTYAARNPRAPGLARRIGTALGAASGAWLCGLLALAASLQASLRWTSGGEKTRYAQALAVIVALGFGSLLAPYATMLFSHATTAMGVAGALWALGNPGKEQQPGRGRLMAAGLLGALAVSSDYSALPLVLAVWLTGTWGRWRDLGWCLVGALPLGALTATYHTVAFGGPFRIGYDFQNNFEFARSRGTTFSGSPVAGLWELLGWGRGGGGLLVLCPIWGLGFWGLATSRRLWGLLAGCLVQILVLSAHQTPWGGAGEDHRYLIAIYPVLCIGLAAVVERRAADGWRLWVPFAVLCSLSLRVWLHTANWRETVIVPSPGLAAAAFVLLIVPAGLVAWRDLRLVRRSAS